MLLDKKRCKKVTVILGHQEVRQLGNLCPSQWDMNWSAVSTFQVMSVEGNYVKRNTGSQVKPTTTNDCMYFTCLMKEGSVQAWLVRIVWLMWVWDLWRNYGKERLREAKAGGLSDDTPLRSSNPFCCSESMPDNHLLLTL